MTQALEVPCCKMGNTSSTLSATEVNYAPIEKECLAIKVACTKFYQYLYGKQDVIVHSDHQPLETI